MVVEILLFCIVFKRVREIAGVLLFFLSAGRHFLIAEPRKLYYTKWNQQSHLAQSWHWRFRVSDKDLSSPTWRSKDWNRPSEGKECVVLPCNCLKGWWDWHHPGNPSERRAVIYKVWVNSKWFIIQIHQSCKSFMEADFYKTKWHPMRVEGSFYAGRSTLPLLPRMNVSDSSFILVRNNLVLMT